MTWRRVLRLRQPHETRFFVLLGAFGLLLGAGYWFLSYEAAGTALLLGFGLANGIVGGFLAADSAARAGTDDDDRPFLDESGRFPAASLAPFAVGLGVATASTAVVFGAAPLVAGALPLAWGTWTWLRGAGAEWMATEATPEERQADGPRSGRRSAENR